MLMLKAGSAALKSVRLRGNTHRLKARDKEKGRVILNGCVVITQNSNEALSVIHVL